MRCPRRDETPLADKAFPWEDSFSWQIGTCDYCGGLSPAKLFEAILEGAEIVPTDKNYKIYVQSPRHPYVKFYFQHMTPAEQMKFVDLLNAGKINIAEPGFFSTLPFFCEAAS